MKFTTLEKKLQKESKGKKYTPTKKGRYTKKPLKEKLGAMMSKLVQGTPTDVGFYQDVAAVFADAAKVFQYHIKKKVKDAQEGFFFKIVGKAKTMRKKLNWGPVFGAIPAFFSKSKSIYKKFNQCRGPSSTTLATLNLAKFVGCNKEQMRAIAWGLFAWWRTTKRPFHAYHTFKETLMILNAYLGEQFFQTLPAEPSLKKRGKLESEQGFLKF
jgi:hypothetical protein